LALEVADFFVFVAAMKGYVNSVFNKKGNIILSLYSAFALGMPFGEWQ